jgi:hypothetical protein
MVYAMFSIGILGFLVLVVGKFGLKLIQTRFEPNPN